MLMDSYSYTSYADSGDSSPRSNFGDHPQPSKVKFMCSYGGKIQPRPHDNQFSYVGGETKILALDRPLKFPALIAKLTALCHREVSFKYQLPGEDLDALISVTNDDDLEHMMHEYDRLNKASPSPAKLRLFLLPVSAQSPALTPVHSFGSTDQDHALSYSRLQSSSSKETASRTQIVEQEQETEVIDERIQKHIRDLQKLGIADQEQQQALFRNPSNDNLIAGDYHVPKVMENIAPQITTIPPEQQPVYMIQTPPPASMYHAPNAMPVTAPVNGYYVQRMPACDQQVYNVMPQAQPTQQQFVAQTYTEAGYQMVADGGRQMYYTTHGVGAVVAQPLQQQYQPMAVTLNQENGGNVVAKEFM